MYKQDKVDVRRIACEVYSCRRGNKGFDLYRKRQCRYDKDYVHNKRRHRYEIRINPQIIILKRYEACEFEIFIKSVCTTSLEDTIRLVTVNMKKGTETFNEVQISFTTQLSTKLDPNELIEEEVLGEESFGIVYRETFRGQKVAIKMKNLENEGDQKKLTWKCQCLTSSDRFMSSTSLELSIL